jgi:dihydropyrimidinase
MDLVIKNATIVDESGITAGSLGVKGGKIAAVAARGVPLEAARVIDARGKLVLPGAIDAHVHLELAVGRLVSADDFASGTRAAAFGGVTTVIDFALQAKGRTLAEAVRKRRAAAETRSAVDFAFHGAITDWSERTRREMRSVARQGITSFKLFMTYEERGLAADDGALLECLREAAALDAVVGVHAENSAVIARATKRALAAAGRSGRPTGRPARGRVRGGAYLHALSRPNVSESEAVARAAYLASVAGARLHIFHLSTLEAAEVVEQWAEAGYPVTAETCPQYLVLDDSYLKRADGHLYATCPPLRTRADRAHLWQALERRSVDLVATDHCPFTRAQKATWRGDFRKIPFGVPGVETLLPLLFTEGVLAGRISLATLVDAVAARPARIFGLYPRKGTLRVGSDADILIIDPEREVEVTARRLHMMSDYSPYAGRRLKGFPEVTILRGSVIQENGRFVGSPGGGIFLKRS